jgi:hypothetical protein
MFHKVRFTSRDGSRVTAGLVLPTEQIMDRSPSGLSRFFPMSEARAMDRLQISPTFETWAEAFAHTF